MKRIYYASDCAFSSAAARLVNVVRDNQYEMVPVISTEPGTKLSGDEVMVIGLPLSLDEVITTHTQYESFKYFGLQAHLDQAWRMTIPMLHRHDDTHVRVAAQPNELLELVWRELYPNIAFEPEVAHAYLD